MIQSIWNKTKELGFLIIQGTYLFFAALIILFCGIAGVIVTGLIQCKKPHKYRSYIDGNSI
tara:strand:+ start:228 stop:410 length:183 start_codon:yes stop_codon:yes gene_type:complete